MDKVLRNVIILSALILIIAIGAVAQLYVSKHTEKTNEVTGASTNAQGAQVVNVIVSGNKYILAPSVVKKDIPVRLVIDMGTVKGCARSIVLPDFGINKYVSPGDNFIEFTPTKTGTMKIVCSMSMFSGEFTVE